MSLQRADVDLAGKAAKVLDDIRRDAPKNAVPGEVISQLKRLPSVLQTSGVPATMAFLYAKAGKEQASLEKAYAAIRDALLKELAGAWNWTDQPQDALDFFKRLHTTDAAALSRASLRLREFSLWLRRLAEAIEHSQASGKPRRPGGRDA